MEKWRGKRVGPPLGVLKDGFGESLAKVGYSDLSIRNLVLVMANLARWMREGDLALSDLSAGEVERYVAYRRAAGYTAWRTVEALAPLLGYLRTVGMPPEPPPPVPVTTETDALLAEFEAWLATDRHLGPISVKRHLVWAAQFVELYLRGPGGEISGQVGVEDVEAFVAHAASRWAVTSMSGPTAALRYWLMFLSRVGLCERGLVAAVPKTRQYLRLGLPTAHSPEAVAAVLATGEEGSRAALRDAAITGLVTDLGLRAAEVARLMLEDIDWAHSAITITGKNGLRERMPLTSRAGGLVARWLQEGREPISTRHVFHTVQAPLHSLTGMAAKDAVIAASRRASIAGFTSRSARHVLGCAVISGDGAIEDARQLLRHQSAASTSIYARLDKNALAELAIPWPGATS